MQYIFNSALAEETEALGKMVGKLLFPGAVIYLNGDLGTGKTVFARGVGLGLGVSTPIVSPTFTLLNVHQGRAPFIILIYTARKTKVNFCHRFR